VNAIVHSQPIYILYEGDFDKFYSTDLKRRGLSVHRNVIVLWDEDQDTRIITFLDELPTDVVGMLAAAGEHEGTLSLIWKDLVPDAYRMGKSVVVEGDCWSIQYSIPCPELEEG
jgi:hypothetical protein